MGAIALALSRSGTSFYQTHSLKHFCTIPKAHAARRPCFHSNRRSTKNRKADKATAELLSSAGAAGRNSKGEWWDATVGSSDKPVRPVRAVITAIKTMAYG